jgi:hypothetical protein
MLELYDIEPMCDDSKIALLLEEENALTPRNVALIKAMLRVYFNNTLHLPMQYKEVTIDNDEYIGVIDGIAKDVGNTWWVVENKTCDKLNLFKPYTLKYDQQIGWYALHVNLIAEKLGLSVDNWRGVKYREVEKSSYKMTKKDGNDIFTLFMRMVDNIDFRETTILKKDIDIEYHQQQFFEARVKVNSVLLYGAHKNRSACMGYMGNSPCKYFSQCWDVTYSALTGDTVDEVLNDGDI